MLHTKYFVTAFIESGELVVCLLLSTFTFELLIVTTISFISSNASHRIFWFVCAHYLSTQKWFSSLKRSEIYTYSNVNVSLQWMETARVSCLWTRLLEKNSMLFSVQTRFEHEKKNTPKNVIKYYASIERVQNMLEPHSTRREFGRFFRLIWMKMARLGFSGSNFKLSSGWHLWYFPLFKRWLSP